VEAEADVDDVRELVIVAWRRVLGPDRDFEDSHDFFEIGGHSLLALRVIKYLSSRLQIEIPVETPFQAPRLGDLIPAIRRLRDDAA
jgi:acyl carrier protein